MTEASGERLSPDLPVAPVGRVFARPRAIAIACVALLAGLGWIYFALMIAAAASRGELGALGPGMGLFDLLTGSGGVDVAGRAIFDVLCRPSFGSAAATWVDHAVVLAMWIAMVLAMMLPSAAPMILTYAEIAETAAAKGERAVSPLVLAAGYAAVWVAVAVVATGLQAALTWAALLDPAMRSASPLFSGGLFMIAGAYQFSALKHACVTRCQRPFPFFFANWSTQTAAIFQLGLRQGLYCVGCCWAAMAVMFAVGTMNVIWMAGLGVIMTIEKLATTTRFSKAVGVIFGLVGAAFILTAIVAQWPVRAG